MPAIFTNPPDEPMPIFDDWMAAAKEQEINDANAMALATSDGDNFPNARMVLLKDYDARGFVFYTNQNSQKGAELADNAQAALCFHWKSLRQQVRVRGLVQMVSAAESDAYYASRSRQNRIGAWASQQSEALDAYASLEAAFAHYDKKYPNNDIPRPPHWVGYRIAPLAIEFWQDGAHRLHHRLLYRRDTIDAAWQTALLNP